MRIAIQFALVLSILVSLLASPTSALETCLPQPPSPDEPHPLRPNPGEVCTATIPQGARLTCGTDLVAVKKMKLPRGGPGCLPKNPTPGQQITCKTDVTVRDVPISIGLSDLELPIAGIASNTTAVDGMSETDNMSQYTSWYLQGAIGQSTQETELTGDRSVTAGIGISQTNPVRLLLLGDSITNGEYPCQLKKMLDLGGYTNVSFTGNISLSCGVKHEGHSGFTTKQILDIQSQWANQSADVAIIHLGTNDVYQGRMGETSNNLRQIVDILKSRQPGIQVILAQIIPSLDNPMSEVNQQIASLANELGVATVNAGQYFNPSSLSSFFTDNVHPNAQGGQAMSKVFFSALTSQNFPRASQVQDSLTLAGPLKKLFPKEMISQKKEELIQAAVRGTTYNQIIGYVKDNIVIGRLEAKTLLAQNPRRTDVEKIRLTDMAGHIDPPYVEGNTEAVKWYTLWQQTPFTQTVDLPGEIFATLSLADPSIKNAKLNITSSLKDLQVAFPHLLEDEQLSQLLQSIFRAPDAPETSGFTEPNSVNYSGVNRQTPFNTNYCDLSETYSNPGDNLESTRTITGTFQFTRNVEYSYAHGEVGKDGLPLTTVEVDVTGPVSVYARQPLAADSIYDRLVGGPSSVFKALFPNIQDTVGGLKDLPAAARLRFSCGGDCEVWPGNRKGRSAEIFFAHWGSVLKYFHGKLQELLSPLNLRQSAATPTSYSAESSSPFAGSDMPAALAAAASRHGVPLKLLQVLYQIEGTEHIRDNSCAVSISNAIGPMQIVDGQDSYYWIVTSETERQQLNLCNPGDAAEIAARIIKSKVGAGSGSDFDYMKRAADGYYGDCKPDRHTQRYWGENIGYCDYLLYTAGFCSSLTPACDKE